MYTCEEPRYVDGNQVGTILIDYVEWTECKEKILGAHALASTYDVTMVVDKTGVLVVDTMTKKTIMAGYHDKSTMLYWFPLDIEEAAKTKRLKVHAFLPDVRAQATEPAGARQEVLKQNWQLQPEDYAVSNLQSPDSPETGLGPTIESDESDAPSQTQRLLAQNRARRLCDPVEAKQWSTYQPHREAIDTENQQWSATAQRHDTHRHAIAALSTEATRAHAATPAVSTRTRAQQQAQQHQQTGNTRKRARNE